MSNEDLCIMESAYLHSSPDKLNRIPRGLTLEPISKNNLAEMFECRNQYGIRKWCRQIGLLNYDNHLDWYESQRKNKSIEMMTIYNEELNSHGLLSSSFIGVCGLTSIDLINRHAEFSLYISTKHQGKGYAKKALKQLLLFGFDELNLNTIWGETFEGNPAIELFKKVGFKLEGTRRSFYFKEGRYLDAHLVSIKKEEMI